MGIVEISAPLPAPPAPQTYSLTAGEIKLYQWAIRYKAYKDNPKAVRAIESYLYRKPGSSLDILTSNEYNALKTQAASLGVPVGR